MNLPLFDRGTKETCRYLHAAIGFVDDKKKKNARVTAPTVTQAFIDTGMPEVLITDGGILFVGS